MINKKIFKLILRGEIISLKTETVFGLFCLPNIKNKQKLNKLKQREKNQNIQLSFGNFEQIFNWVNVNKWQKKILKNNLPGINSYLVKTHKDKIKIIGSETILVRFSKVENNTKLIKLLNKVGPLFSTSVNIHGEKELNNCKDIKNKFNIYCYNKDKIKMIGKSSKIISLINNKEELLRE